MWERLALDAWNVVLSVVASAIFVALGFWWAWHKVRRQVRREWQGELEKARLETRLEATERATAISLELGEYKEGQAAELRVVATTLAQTTAVMTSKMDHLVLVTDGLALSSVRLEKLLLNQVKLLAARAMHAAAIVTAQEVKALLAKDLTDARTEIEDLHATLAALTQKEGH